MGWVFLEIVVALAVAIAIVWWTFPRKRKGESAAAERKDSDAGGA